MAVQKPALNQALQNWQQRSRIYAQLGIPAEKYHQIAQHDITNVANNGSSPMTTAEVNAAMLGQMAGRSVLGNPTPHGGGLLHDLGEAVNPGNWAKDVGGLLSGLIGGTVNFVHHLPSEVTNTGALIEHMGDDQWKKEHGYETGGLGAGIRDLAKSPVLNLIPGLADVADLTSAQGRAYLSSHPVSGLLDVAPAAGELGRIGRLGEAGAAGSAMEALQQGRAVRAGVRAGRQGLNALTGGRVAALTPEFYADIANQLGVSELYRSAVLRPHAVIGRQYSAKLIGIVRNIGDEVWKMQPAERAEFFQNVRDPNVDVHGMPQATFNERHQALIDRLRGVQNELVEYGRERYSASKGKEGLLVLPHGRGRMVFAAKSEVAKHARRIDRLSETKAKVLKVREAEKEAITIRVEHAQKLIRDIQDPTLSSLARNQKINELNKLAHSIELHKKYLVNAQTRFEKYDELLHERQEQLHDGLLRSGGPAAVHPLVDHNARAQFMQIAKEQHSRQRQIQRRAFMRASSPRHNPQLYQQRQILQLQQLRTNLDRIEHATRFDEIKSAIMGPMYRRDPLPDPKEEGISDKQAKQRSKAQRTQDKAATKYDAATEAHAQKLYDDTMKGVVTSVLDLVAHGYDPIWMKHVEPGEEEAKAVLHVEPLPDRIIAPRQYNEKVFNFAPRSQDVALGLVAGAQELFRDQATREFILPLISHFGVSRQALEEEYKGMAKGEHAVAINPRSKNIAHARTVAGHAQVLMAREWKEIDPKHYGVKRSDVVRFAKNDTIMIPKTLADNLESMMPKGTDIERRLPLVSSAYDKSLRVFRFSVLTGPRHLVHVAVAGLLPLMLREPGALGRVIPAWKLLHEGAAPIDLTKHLYTFQTDQIYNYAVGHQYGTWLKQAWMNTGFKVSQRLAKIEETASDVYRVSAMLAAEGRGIDREQAIVLANKVAVEMDDMAPWERTIMKQVFPFYAFTRFLFRYLLSYPVDHPYRVSILSRFSEQENEEWNSLLPTKFMQMLWLGKPDHNGNIMTIDYKNLNPFRSFSNDFTMVGFFQSLNPILSAPFAARGFSTLTGVGDLYPQVQFNPQSGSLQAAPPAGKDEIMSVMEQFVPELGAVDHFLGITNNMRQMKRSSPQTYRSLLFSQLNIPLAPVSVNKPYVQEKTEMDRYKAAQSAVSKGEKTNDWTNAEQYQLVPYQGHYVSPKALEAYWQQLITRLKKAGMAGVDPRALLATPIHRTSPNPTELLGGMGLPPAQSNFGL